MSAVSRRLLFPQVPGILSAGLLALLLLLVSCASGPQHYPIWASVGGPSWKPPEELQPDVRLLLTRLASVADEKFENVKDYPYRMSTITVTVSFDPERRVYKVIEIRGSRSREVLDAVQSTLLEALSGLKLSPAFQEWLPRITQIGFVF